jgi:hypothetical protein
VPIKHCFFKLLQIPFLQQFFFLNFQPFKFSYCTKKLKKMPIFGRFATHLQQLQKNKFENREFLKAEVAGSMGLSAVIARLLSHFY